LGSFVFELPHGHTNTQTESQTDANDRIRLIDVTIVTTVGVSKMLGSHISEACETVTAKVSGESMLRVWTVQVRVTETLMVTAMTALWNISSNHRVRPVIRGNSLTSTSLAMYLSTPHNADAVLPHQTIRLEIA